MRPLLTKRKLLSACLVVALIVSGCHYLETELVLDCTGEDWKGDLETTRWYFDLKNKIVATDEMKTETDKKLAKISDISSKQIKVTFAHEELNFDLVFDRHLGSLNAEGRNRETGEFITTKIATCKKVDTSRKF